MEVLKAKNFESCRLCLAEIRDTNITLLDGIIKDMLEIILPELNLSICKTPAICKACLETLKQSYNFKSSCLEVEDKVQFFVDPKSRTFIDLKQILEKENTIYQISENHIVCRTCLGLGEESAYTKLCSYDGDPLKNMVEKCLPELGIDLTKDPIICPVCLEQLEEQFNFIMQCLDTEEKINYYCERKKTFKQIDLHSVYLFSMIEDNEELEKHYEVMENGNIEKICTAVTVEDNSNMNDGLKQQLLQETVFVDLTKEAFGIGIKKDETKNDKSVSSPNLDNLKVHLFESRHSQANEPLPPTEEVTFQISKDGNGEDIITSQTSRIHTEEDDSDVSVTREDALLTTRFVEDISGVVKKKKRATNVRKKTVSSKEKVEYKDDKDEDDGEGTDDSSRSKKRLVTRKCKLCDFKTKYTSRMKAHRTVYHSDKTNEPEQDTEPPKKVAKSKPKPVSSSKASVEKQGNDQKQTKCHLCGQAFVRVVFLKKHIEAHNSGSFPSIPATFTKAPAKTYSRQRGLPAKRSFSFSGQVLKMFKCQICPYQTRMRSNLVRHSLTHKTTTEIVKHKCKFCNFNTIHKENFLTHMQSHSHDSENQVKKCFLCSFQPKTEEALKQHVNSVHKSGTG